MKKHKVEPYTIECSHDGVCDTTDTSCKLSSRYEFENILEQIQRNLDMTKAVDWIAVGDGFVVVDAYGKEIGNVTESQMSKFHKLAI